MEKLTQKWIEACKESIHELVDLQKQTTIKEVLQAFHIEPELVGYDDEEEDFK